MESFLLEFYKTLKFGKIKYKNMTHRQLSLKTRSKNLSYLRRRRKRKGEREEEGRRERGRRGGGGGGGGGGGVTSIIS